MHFSTTVLAFGAIASMAVAAPVAEPEAAWHSKFRYFPGQPIGKRDAEADPAWHSKFRYFPGQPIGKREAEAEAEADPAWHSKFRYFPGQPIGKREADEEDVEADVVEEEAAEEDSE
jgi:mating pheromone alpha-factor